MSTPSVTKEDMCAVANAFKRGEGHLRIVINEILEIFDDGTYTLTELRTLKGNEVYKDIPPVYITEKDFQSWSPAYREKFKNIPKVGDKYEWFPRRILKYDRYLIPLFYSALVCKGVTDRQVIKIVTELVFQDHGWFQDDLSKKYGLPSLYSASDLAKSSAALLFDKYLRQKEEIV